MTFRTIHMLAALLMLAATTAARAEVKAAAASRDVTPAELIPITSGGPARASMEKKGKLEVRVLVLESDGVRLAVVSEPFIGFPHGLCQRVYDLVPGIPAENILIGATHTHGAPDPYGFPSFVKGGGANMPYLTMACEKTAEAINEAVEKLRPATIRINTDKAQGKIAYNYYAPQLYDPRCNVLQALDGDGTVIATLVNYAIHPEVLLNKPVMTPDVIGPLYDRIAELGGGVGVFMNSAQGGMITADVRDTGGDKEEYSECVRIGTLLANEAMRIGEAARPQEDFKITVVSRDVDFPLPPASQTPMFHMLRKSPVGFRINEQDNTIKVRLNAVNIGNAQMLTIPGEALPNIGFYLKRKMHGKFNFLLGLTNDANGYILTKVDWMSFDRYQYVSETSLGEMTGEILIDEGLKLVDTLPRVYDPAADPDNQKPKKAK